MLRRFALSLAIIASREAAGDRTDQSVLAAAPPTVTISGLSCHQTANAVYTLQPSPLNGKPCWVSADGGWQLYWTSQQGLWFIDDDPTDDTRAWAYIDSADSPPTGARAWQEACDGSFGDVLLTLDAPLSAANCAALAAATLSQPTCDGVLEHIGATSPRCPLACAELWTEARNRCSVGSASAFDAAAPDAIRTACTAAVAAVLLKAPPAITVSGLSCHVNANAEYLLQPMLLNGKPQYATRNAAGHLYHMIDRTGTKAWAVAGQASVKPTQPWAFFEDGGRESLFDIPGISVDSDGRPPTGFVWYEFCHEEWIPATLTLAGPLSEQNCAALATATLALPACASASTKQDCSKLCAELWLGARSRCSGKAAEAFDAAAPTVAVACSGTAAAVLATAPRTVFVSAVSGQNIWSACSGLRDEESQTSFTRQSTLVSQRPYYSTPDGVHHIYYSWVDEEW